MWGRFFLARISPPAIWGRLPAHADFVRSGVRHREAEAWEGWLRAVQPAPSEAPPDDLGVTRAGIAGLPIAFVLPAASLGLGAGGAVLGAMVASQDKVGRQHPLIVYQRASRQWLVRHFSQADGGALGWQWMLARLLARRTRSDAGCTLSLLAEEVEDQWRLWSGGSGRSPGQVRPPVPETTAMHPGTDGEVLADDPAASLHGVQHLPWPDWPQRLHGAQPRAAFWQQDAHGRIVMAAERLQPLWKVAS